MTMLDHIEDILKGVPQYCYNDGRTERCFITPYQIEAFLKRRGLNHTAQNISKQISQAIKSGDTRFDMATFHTIGYSEDEAKHMTGGTETESFAIYRLHEPSNFEKE